MKTICRYLPAIAFPFVLASCSSVKSSGESSVDLPVSWRNAVGFPTASPNQDLSRWWKRFDDPVLTRVISLGLNNSPDIASAAARIRQARARRSETASALFPSIFASTGRNSVSSKSDGFRRDSGTTYSSGLDASWEIDWFGKNRANLAAANADAAAAEENFHSVQASLASEIAATYTDIRANEARLAVLRKNVTTREETAQLATWRQQAGEADSLESSQAQSSLESARAAIPSLQQAIAQGRNQLSFLAGRAPGTLDSMLTGGKGIPNPAKSLAIGIPADVLRQRPDVRNAGHQVLAAAARTRAANAERYPSLNLSGSLGLNTVTSRNFLNPETATFGLFSGISSPIFDAGRIRANIEATSAAEQQAISAYRSAVLVALTETENALIACLRTAERLTSLEKATRLAREADQLARQRYEAGEIDFLDVLDSQRTLLSLEDSLLSTRTDRTTSYIRLYQALGGGWSSGS